ncbi:MAG: 4-(cytidine 5'-diphospho)-2-C-methyl-D-erythritol kinase [Bacteroidetes bacterium]|nr:4-(cytidine 5'-diphospho)-2-C-methyl-D-erythritol kinase [Bacteroidota bacterium]
MNGHAYAKINLGLHIVAKRADGFHDIETIFHRTSLRDDISVTASDRISVSCTVPGVPTDERNHCWKAVELLREALGVRAAASVSITKRIPAGAGLGGGSSDAATVLRLLPAVWNVKAPTELLHSVALRIGSDVPYFLTDGTAYAEGRGEVLRTVPLDLPYWILLVNPNIHIPTPWAYGALAARRNGAFPVRPSLGERFAADPAGTVLAAGNDFEEVVFEQYPAIAGIKQQLLSAGAVSSVMSGSGSTVYGLFADAAAAKNAALSFSNAMFVHLTEPHFVPV